MLYWCLFGKGKTFHFFWLGCAPPCSMSCCLGHSMVHLSVPYPTPLHKKGAVFFRRNKSVITWRCGDCAEIFCFLFGNNSIPAGCCLWFLPSDTSHQLGVIWTFTGSSSSIEICMWKLPSFATYGYTVMIRSVPTSPSPLAVSNFPSHFCFSY